MKQKAPTTKTTNDFWDYVGSHREIDFRVRKMRDGRWEGESDLADTDAAAHKKRDVVNAIVDEIDVYYDEEIEKPSYEEDMYDGLPMFKVKLVKERDYTFDERKKVNKPADLREFLRPYFAEKDRETVLLILLDVGNSVIGLHEISTGGLSSSIIDIRSIFKTALLANANAIMLAHNHPSGNTEVSRADIDITRRVRDAGETMDIQLFDHLVFGDSVTSMKERRLF